MWNSIIYYSNTTVIIYAYWDPVLNQCHAINHCYSIKYFKKFDNIFLIQVCHCYVVPWLFSVIVSYFLLPLYENNVSLSSFGM